jgi:NADH-quinone oxidoreductase subunit G
MPKLTIDGRTVEVDAGQTVIQAIDRLGVDVPRYCYHPRLPVAGNCRMCLVEIERMPKLVTSCTTPATEGMVVRTTTPRVKEGQASVLEFLLLNHPLDCPICDKAGECDLQDLYFAHSAHDSRLGLEEKVHKPKNQDIGRYIVLDSERCILCTRCIRFMDVVARDPVLGIIQRGDHSQLSIFPGKRLDSRYSINTADICPVGALTSKEFRFRKRVWFLGHTRSVCPNCATGCPVVIDHHEGHVYRMMPGRRDGVETWLCDPGRLGYGFVNDPGRPRMPVKQGPDTKGQPVITSWEDATAAAAAAIREVVAQSGAAAVAGIFGNWCTNEEAHGFVRLMRGISASSPVAYFKPQVGLVDSGPADDVLVREDKNPNTRGAGEIASSVKVGTRSVAEVLDGISGGRIRALIVADPDLLARLPEGRDRKRAAEALRKLRMLVVLSPLACDTSRLAHVHLPTATWAEKDGTFTNGDGLVQRIRRAFAPQGQVLPDLEALARLATALDVKLGSPVPAEAFGAVADAVAAFKGLRWPDLEAQEYLRVKGAPAAAAGR